MRTLVFAAAAALALAASAPADAGQSNDIVENKSGRSGYAEESVRSDFADEARLEGLNDQIAWLDQLEADLASGSLILVKPGDVDGGLRAMYVPVDRDDVIRMIRIKVSLGEITSEQGAAALIVMASETARVRRQFRTMRERLAVQRQGLRGGVLQQPWARGRPPPQAAVPQRSACPAATRWQIEVRGAQYSYHFVLVIRQDGTAAVVLPSGDVMTWVQTQARISGNTLTLDTRDTNGSGSLRATLTPDCLRGTGQSQAYNGNNGPATLTRLN